MSRWDSPSFNSSLAGEALGRGPLSPFFYTAETRSLYESNNALDPEELGAPTGGERRFGLVDLHVTVPDRAARGWSDSNQMI